MMFAVVAAAFILQGFMVNYDLERDIWQKGFASLAAAAAGQLPGIYKRIMHSTYRFCGGCCM
jgi:hypothetical protein